MKASEGGFGRIIAMEGGHNFRDLGGYPTIDGRTVATGVLFRSGTMAELSDADHDILDSLNLKLIFDLRGNKERSRRPSKLPQAPAFEIWSRDHDVSAGDLTTTILSPGATAEMVRSLSIESYRSLAYEQADSYRELFLRIARGQLPLVFHCSAGKDRTGIAAALLLDMLGVPRDHVFADYVLTDHCMSRNFELVVKDPFGAPFAAVDRAVWAPLMRADPDYLAAAFETIDQDHGSTHGFVREVLGLSDSDVAAVREQLLA